MALVHVVFHPPVGSSGLVLMTVARFQERVESMCKVSRGLGLKLAWRHFLHLLLAHASDKASQDSRSEEIDSTSSWEELQGYIEKDMDMDWVRELGNFCKHNIFETLQSTDNSRAMSKELKIPDDTGAGWMFLWILALWEGGVGRTLNGNDAKMLRWPNQAVGAWLFFKNVVLGALSKGRVYPENRKSKPRKNPFCKVKVGRSSADLDQIQGRAQHHI